jgi:NAD(P)-dependent dehydrogenase (short-subunit alcohol dehydrogenase family)
MALLQGKVAAITGAVTGIGKAIAIDYLRHGASVAVNYFPDERSAQQFEDLRREVGENSKLIGVPGDITKPETGQELVKKAVEAFGGRLDVFVSIERRADGSRRLVEKTLLTSDSGIGLERRHLSIRRLLDVSER